MKLSTMVAVPALWICAIAGYAGAQGSEKHIVISKDAPTASRDGRQIYAATCAACHQPSGEGMPERYPPLASSEWVTGNADRLLRIILHGLTGEIEVQGEVFSGAMPPWGALLKDAEIAAVATYVRSSFGNKAAPVTEASVARVRTATASRKTPFTVAELSNTPTP